MIRSVTISVERENSSSSFGCARLDGLGVRLGHFVNVLSFSLSLGAGEAVLYFYGMTGKPISIPSVIKQ